MKFLRGRTLKDSVTLKGVGIHTGEVSRITIHPSAKRGIYFYKNGVKIPALHQYVVNTVASTDLCNDGKCVRTVEHLMAAFYLLGIDSAVVEVEGLEIPIADGSAKVFFDLISDVGIEELDHPQRYFKIVRPEEVRPNGIFARLKVYNGERLVYEDVFNHLGRRKAVYEGEAWEALVGARTFCYIEDVPLLWLLNLGRGGNPINTLPLDENLCYLVYGDEPVNHKLLDLIGDIALVGGRIWGEIYSSGGNHTLNHMVREVILKGGVAKEFYPPLEVRVS